MRGYEALVDPTSSYSLLTHGCVRMMTRYEFRKLLESREALTRSQKQRLIDELKKELLREASIDLIESRFEKRKRCPHCGGGALLRWGSAHRLQRYRCRACKKTCNALTGTALARLRYKERWLSYCECLYEGRSVREAARRSGIDKTTAFRWRHRFLRQPTKHKAPKMVGIVEADETFFRESAKGSKRLHHRPARKRGVGRNKEKAEQVPVLVVRDRSGSVADLVFERLEKERVHACLKPLLSEELVLCTDGSSLYSTFAKEQNIPHKRIIALDKGRVIDNIFHLQNLNAYISRLKNWMLRFKGVSTEYLSNYLGWRRLLEKHNGQPPAEFCLYESLGGMPTNQQLLHT